MKGLVARNRAFQEQTWQHQQDKFNERKNRRLEVVGFIKNRGEADWTGRENRFMSEWRKWWIDTRDEIERGEQARVNELKEMNREMDDWKNDTSNASTREAAARLVGDLSGRINSYVASLKKRLPGDLDIDLNTDRVEDHFDKVTRKVEEKYGGLKGLESERGF